MDGRDVPRTGVADWRNWVIGVLATVLIGISGAIVTRALDHIIDLEAVNNREHEDFRRRLADIERNRRRIHSTPYGGDP